MGDKQHKAEQVEQTPAPGPQTQAPAVENSVAQDELAEQMSQDAESPYYITYNHDPTLEPIGKALNDESLSFEQRARMIVAYRDAQVGGLNLSGINAMTSMATYDKDEPMTLVGDKAGMHHNLLDKLADDPKMVDMMTDLSARIAAGDPGSLDIEQIFEETQDRALANADEGEAAETTRLRSLQAMATLVNCDRFGKDGLPPELAARLPEGLYDQMKAAKQKMQQSESPFASVMSHGVPSKVPEELTEPFTADHNYHFFSHAYLTAALMHDQGLDADQAMHVSGVIGAQYELKPSSLGEGQGNSGIKDLLMNAEGAAFGAQSMMGAPLLPSTFDGPKVESRNLPDVAANKLPEEVAEIAEDADTDLAARLFEQNNEEVFLKNQPAWAPPFYLQM